MNLSPRSLRYVYLGWDGYNTSLVNAVAPLTAEQMQFRPSPEMRSVAELVWHLADGRVDWFVRLNAPGGKELMGEIERREVRASDDAAAAVEWLNRTWAMVQATLDQWTVDDLPATYEQPYQGVVYAVSRQWVIWRIMAHDIQHGGQLSELLGVQGIFPQDLTYLGGHLTVPDVV